MRYIITTLTILLLACGNEGGSDCPNGSEGCPCTASGYCDPPASCVGDVCVAPGDTGTDTVVDTVDDTGTTDLPGDRECAADEDCNDADPCTSDVCDEYGDCQNPPLDEDGDGYPAIEADGVDCGGTDCLDNLATAYPGASPVECSELDNDCNGEPDEDNDGDGYISYVCVAGDDCDDSDAEVHVGNCVGSSECCDGCWKQGCWIDPVTGYLWEDPNMSENCTWADAQAHCDTLSVAGHGAGEWTVPTISQLRSFIRGCTATETGGSCGFTDDCLDPGSTCNNSGCADCSGVGPGTDGCFWPAEVEGPCLRLWSSSQPTGEPDYALYVDFTNGYVSFGINVDVASSVGVRCVHTGS